MLGNHFFRFSCQPTVLSSNPAFTSHSSHLTENAGAESVDPRHLRTQEAKKDGKFKFYVRQLRTQFPLVSESSFRSVWHLPLSVNIMTSFWNMEYNKSDGGFFFISIKTGLRDAKIAGKKMLHLSMSVKVFPEKISIWTMDWVKKSTLISAVGITHATENTVRTKNVFTLLELGQSLSSVLPTDMCFLILRPFVSQKETLPMVFLGHQLTHWYCFLFLSFPPTPFFLYSLYSLLLLLIISSPSSESCESCVVRSWAKPLATRLWENEAAIEQLARNLAHLTVLSRQLILPGGVLTASRNLANLQTDPWSTEIELIKAVLSQPWWYMLLIPVLRRHRQEELCDFQARLSYISETLS